MDFESPDVEKDFPGLYASESGRKSNESDFSDGGDHDKPSKKDLLGRRKEKKEKKDRGYAALEGESSPEEDTDTKSPSKSKKTKSFKFPTKSKEKREKSRDKEKVLEDSKLKELQEKEKKKEKEREREKKEKEKEKEKKEKEKREKLKEKDKEKEEKAKFKLESKEKLKDDKKDKSKEKVKDKEKEKSKEKDREKVKDKDKDKKEKKLTKIPSTVTAGVPFEEIFTLGVALPIFGVPLEQAVERAPCHDDTGLPLVFRDCVDYLQANIKSEQIYRAEADGVKLQQLRRLYTDRGVALPYHFDVPVAGAMLKMFLSELPAPLLTLEWRGRWEQACALAEPARRAAAARLLAALPAAPRAALAWLLTHLADVLANTQHNHATPASLMSYFGPALGMSSNLFTYLIGQAHALFPDVTLTKYVPPLAALPADFPAEPAAIAAQLRQQESLLRQIHAEMHAGFASPPRDQQLWEAQRIVTELKRKLRSVQKSAEPAPAPAAPPPAPAPAAAPAPAPPADERAEPPPSAPEPEPSAPDDRAPPPAPPAPPADAFTIDTEQVTDFTAEFEDNFDFADNEPVTPDDRQKTPSPKPKTPQQADKSKAPAADKPKLTDEELARLRLELEHAEYQQLKSLLQAKINSEQFEIVKLRSQIALKTKEGKAREHSEESRSPEEEAELKQKLIRENALLEQKRLSLVNQIFQERVACTQLKIELALKELI